MTPRTIALLLPDLGGGGAERVALTLAKAFLDRGHEVDILVMERTGDLLDAVPPAIRIVDLGAKRIRDVFRPLVRYLRDRRPDAIQISMWPLTVVGILAVKLSRVSVRCVVSDHVALSRQYGANRLAMLALRSTIRLIYPLAGARVCVSRGVAADLAAISHLPLNMFQVIYNPIAVPRDIETNAAVESQWLEEGARILAVGTLKAQKNHALLLDAFARLSDTKTQLMILGDGPLRKRVEQKAIELGVHDRLGLPGFVVDPAPYYASADLFVLSSDYEGFGNVIVEAMHAGLPIVSTDCPSGPAEILDGGRFGALVSLGDAASLASAIESALREPRSDDRQKSRAADFCPERIAEQYLSLLIA